VETRLLHQGLEGQPDELLLAVAQDLGHPSGPARAHGLPALLQVAQVGSGQLQLPRELRLADAVRLPDGLQQTAKRERPRVLLQELMVALLRSVVMFVDLLDADELDLAALADDVDGAVRAAEADGPLSQPGALEGLVVEPRHPAHQL